MSTVDVGLTAANTNVPTKPHFDNKSMHEHHQIGSNVLSENKNAPITTRNEDNSPNRPAFDAHNDQFDFSPSPSQSGKNLKNLKLELNHDNLSDTSSLPDVNQNQKFESSNNPYQSRNSSSDGPAKIFMHNKDIKRNHNQILNLDLPIQESDLILEDSVINQQVLLQVNFLLKILLNIQ